MVGVAAVRVHLNQEFAEPSRKKDLGISDNPCPDLRSDSSAGMRDEHNLDHHAQRSHSRQYVLVYDYRSGRERSCFEQYQHDHHHGS